MRRIFFSFITLFFIDTLAQPLDKESERNYKKAIEIVKKKGIDLNSVKIEEVENELLYGSEPTGDIEFKMTVKNPIKYKNNTLTAGTEIIHRLGGFNLIHLKNGQIFKINDASCKDNINFKNEQLCKCYIGRTFEVNGFKVEPPALLMFVDNEFKMFHKPSFTYKGESYPIGFYRVNSDGTPKKLPDDEEKFNCEPVN